MDNQHFTPVLHIPCLPDSIANRAYAERVSSQHPLLLWGLQRINSGNACNPAVVLVHSDVDQQICLRLLHSSSTKVFRSRYKTSLAALLDFAEHAKNRTIAFFGIEMSLGPIDLLSRVIRHHIAGQYHFTYVTGFPRSATPRIFNKRLLVQFDDLSLPPDISDPELAITYFQQMRGIPLSAGTFDAKAAYHRETHQLPETIALTTASDVGVLRDAIAACELRKDKTADPCSYFLEWKALSINRTRSVLQLPPSVKLQPLALGNRRRVKRVLFLSHCAAVSWVESSVCSLIKRLDRQRFTPFAFVPVEGKYTESLRAAGAEVICPNQEVHLDGLASGAVLVRALARVRPHILHLNGPAHMGAILVGKLAGTRIVQHVRVGEVSHISEQLCGADAIIAISEYIKRRLNQLTLPIGNLHVVYPGIDTKYFRPGVTSGVEARRSLRIPQTASVIAMVARFSPMKRHDVLIEACQTLTCRLPNLRLLLVSDVGSMENAWFDRVQKFITQKRFRRMVTVLPFCDDVRKVYAAADVAVLPSEGEGLGRCIIEAMAMGTPVVVTDSGGLPELVTDRKTGRVVSSGDQSGLANAIAEVLADPVLRGNLSAAARLFVEKQLTDEESARKVMHIYNQLRPGPGR